MTDILIGGGAILVLLAIILNLHRLEQLEIRDANRSEGGVHDRAA